MTIQFSIEEFRERMAQQQLDDTWSSVFSSKSKLFFKYSLLASEYQELREQIKRIRGLSFDRTIPKEYDLALKEWKKVFLVHFNQTITRLDLKTRAVVERPLSYSPRHLESLHEIMAGISGIKFLSKYEEFSLGKQHLLRLKKTVQSYLIGLKTQKVKKFFHKCSYLTRTENPHITRVSNLWHTTYQDSRYFQQQPVELFTKICEELSLQDLLNLMKTNGFLHNEVKNFISHKCSVIQNVASCQVEKKREACQIAFPIPISYENSKQNLTSVCIFESLVFVGLADQSIKILQYDRNGNFQELQTLSGGHSDAESFIATKVKLYIKMHREIRILTKISDGTYAEVQTIHLTRPITSLNIVKDQIYILCENEIGIWKEDLEGKFILFQTIDSHSNLERQFFQAKDGLIFTSSKWGIIEVFKCASDGKFDWLQDLTLDPHLKIVYLNFIGDLLISQDNDNALHIWKQNQKSKFELTQILGLHGTIDAMTVRGDKYFFIGTHNIRQNIITVFELDPSGKLHFIQTVKNEEGSILDIKVIGNLLFTLSSDQSVKMWEQRVDGKLLEHKKLSSSSSKPIDKGSLSLENWHLFVFNSEFLGLRTLRIFKLLEEGNREMFENDL
jgi:hypothetical protein